MTLTNYTTARVGLGRTGNSLPTEEVLKLRLAHAQAREAVHSALDIRGLTAQLKSANYATIPVKSKARHRTEYLKRPDDGRQLAEASRSLLQSTSDRYDAAFVIADGLSALAANRHAAALLNEILLLLRTSSWRIAPVVIAEQARVALGDDIGECLESSLVIMLIGERPGLSCHDSLGAYLTWSPRRGLTDASRNCVSNIHRQGLTYAVAAHTITFLMNQARARQISGVSLKDTSDETLRLAKQIATIERP